MTATKIIREFLPSSFREAPRAKRRKMKTTPFAVGQEENHPPQMNFERPLSVAPSLFVSRALADHGLPDRLDPFSMDYLMEFDYSDGSHQCDIPCGIIMAIQQGNMGHILPHYHSRDQLAAQRNAIGETLLHLACRWGSVAVVRSLLFDCKCSAFVLDKHGRSPLHSLCMSMNSSSAARNALCGNHLESMRLLLQENPSLILFKDKNGKVPFEYIQQTPFSNSHAPLWTTINELLFSESIAKRLIREMMQKIEKSRSGQRLTMWEKINNMIDLSGLNAAIMETGLSV